MRTSSQAVASHHIGPFTVCATRRLRPEPVPYRPYPSRNTPMSSYSQVDRALAVHTPAGTDALLLERITGTEALNQPFSFRLHLLAETAVDFALVLNQSATLRLKQADGSVRFINGIIC